MQIPSTMSQQQMPSNIMGGMQEAEDLRMLVNDIDSIN